MVQLLTHFKKTLSLSALPPSFPPSLFHTLPPPLLPPSLLPPLTPPLQSSDRNYYYNANTEDTVWERPTGDADIIPLSKIQVHIYSTV